MTRSVRTRLAIVSLITLGILGGCAAPSSGAKAEVGGSQTIVTEGHDLLAYVAVGGVT